MMREDLNLIVENSRHIVFFSGSNLIVFNMSLTSLDQSPICINQKIGDVLSAFWEEN